MAFTVLCSRALLLPVIMIVAARAVIVGNSGGSAGTAHCGKMSH